VIEALEGALIVTADHGNADCMYEIDKKTDEPMVDAKGLIKAKTSHTLNPVPLHIFAPGTSLELVSSESGKSRSAGPAAPGLANLASTILYLMGYDAPDDYERSLIKTV
jgi:2,3-bisphosphoglycerate-independent phosphoglycerate mutase